ncbi:protein FLOURY 1-like [Raphanus sativus]|uniref:Protein FLOURY 1-like n=1 Tax=Raphanus sativus TaxID=3726 RepID=A0A6J0JL25_RAPSA|nr:protein FLOURY 1-like [Raphanus sativus]
MGFASFHNLLSKVDGFGCGFFVFCSFYQIFNLFFLFCLLVLSLKFLLFKGPSLFVQFLEKIYRVSPKIQCCSSFDQDNDRDGFGSKPCLLDELDQKKPVVLHWNRKKTNESCEDCDQLILSDELNLRTNNRDNAETEESEEEEEEESREDQVFDVITLRKMVKRERKRGDGLKMELEKERRAAESAAEEAMAMLLKLRMEKSAVEMEANQYKRVAEQKQVYDQEVIQSLQWMLTKPDNGDTIQD